MVASYGKDHITKLRYVVYAERKENFALCLTREIFLQR